MRKGNWKDIAELIGTAAIVISLIFVGIQLKQSQDVVLSEMDVAINAVGVDITATIGDHAAVWIRGNSGEELDEAERAYYNRLIADIRWRYQASYRRNLRFGREEAARINVAVFATFLHSNPGARQAWSSRSDSLSRHFRILGIPYDGNSFDRAVMADLDTLAHSPD